MNFGFALSGLQDFLYDLSPQTPSREDRARDGGRDRDAARRLRIRSAILSLTPSLVAWDIRQTDPGAEPIYLGGGKLLMSASESAVEAVRPKLVALYDWLVMHSRGKLGAHWASVGGDGPTAEGLRNLLTAINAAKWRAGREDGWTAIAGQIHPTDGIAGLGDHRWEALAGNEFAKQRDWAGFKVGDGLNDAWEIGPWRASPAASSPDIWLAEHAPTGQITVSIPAYTPKLKRDRKTAMDDLRAGDTVPLYLLAEMEQDDITPRAGGAYLGLLKLDGDGIGDLVRRSLDQDIDQYRRVSARLAEFFGLQMMDFLKRQYPRLYLVYSGGDDLVAAGHFFDVLRAARDVNTQYDQLGLGATASAGVSFFTRNAPILKAVESAERELEKAKHIRNAVSIGGCRLSWAKLDTSLREVEALESAMKGERINRGALQLLQRLGKPWLEDAAEPPHEMRWRSIPQIQYMRSRRTGWKESEWPAELTALFDSLSTREDDWKRAAFVGTLAAWKTKQRENDE